MSAYQLMGGSSTIKREPDLYLQHCKKNKIISFLNPKIIKIRSRFEKCSFSVKKYRLKVKCTQLTTNFDTSSYTNEPDIIFKFRKQNPTCFSRNICNK